MSDPTHPRIDAHLHVWKRIRSAYAWLTPDQGELNADFAPEDAIVELAAAGIGGAILVQADDSYADTQFMLEVAAANPWVHGLVAWVPLDDLAAARSALEAWSNYPVIRGVRQLLHIDPRDGMLDDPVVRSALRMVAEAGLAFDVPDAWPRLLSGAGRVAASTPDLTVVIDHLGKPPLGSDAFEAWAHSIRDVAAYSNTVAKLSGLQGIGAEFTAAALRPAWDVALDAFGPSRLAYGGDWPMTVTHGGYATAYTVLSHLIGELSEDEQGEIWCGTARRVYGLEL